MSDKDTMEITKLDGENYTMWKFGIVIVLRAKNLYGFIDGSEKKPDAGKDQSGYIRKQNQVMMLILGSIEKQLQYNLMSCSTPEEMWDKLKVLYGDESIDSKQDAWEKFYLFKISDREPVAVQLEGFECICKKLEDAGDKPSKSGILNKLLSSLQDLTSY